MAVYATMIQYERDYLGIAIAHGDFNRLVLRASAYIDQLTYQRAAAIVLAGTETANIASIMMATCAVADELQAIDASGTTSGIKSESIGNNSVTYMDGSFATLSATARLRQAAKLYLSSTGLMYPGFASGEYGGAFDED